jgi:rhodanese-related sulfurtransferase
MLNHWTRAALLVALSSGAALVANAIRSDSLPWIRDPAASLNPAENRDLRTRAAIDLAEFRRRLRDGSAAFVDARSAAEYSRGHIFGAVSIPSLDKEQHLERVYELLPADQVIIVYCGGGECEDGHMVFEFLAENGIRLESLRIFEPGWEVLGGLEGLPVAKGTE